MPKKKKTKKLTPKQLQDKLWEVIKRVIRYRDGTKCVSCGKDGLMGANQHVGHFIANSVSGAYLRYDLRNLAIQCYNCNLNLGGNSYLYGEYLRKKHGQEFVDQLFIDQKRITKAYDHYERLLKLYTRIVDKLPEVDRKLLYSPCELLEMFFPASVAELSGSGRL